MADAADAGVVVDPGLEDPNVVTKYKMAGEMATRVLEQVKGACKAGSKTVDICTLGDLLIEKEVKGCYNKKNADGTLPKKGVAFPTCVSVNHCVCHNSPLKSDPEIILKDGDVVKIDLGVHIDGFIAPCGATVVVGEEQVTGRKADVIQAAHLAGEVALRMLRPGTKTYAITDAIDTVAKAFNCVAIEGMLSHSLGRNKIDGEKAIIQNPTPQLRKEHKEVSIEVNEVYALDIIMSTGSGKPREGEQRTTVFKGSDTPYSLKMKASRQFVSEMKKNFNLMPFTLRAFPDEKIARMGVIEAVKYDVVDAFKILWERDGELVAQFKMQVLVMPNGNIRGTSTGFNPESVKSDLALEDEALNALLATPVGTKNKKKKKKKKAAATAEGGAAGGDAPAAAE